jgi:hypothetical protein
VVNQDPGLGADGRLGVLMLCAVTPDIVYDESNEEMVRSGTVKLRPLLAE